MGSLEQIAVGFLGSCCVMYGVLGVSVVCTSDNCDEASDSGKAPLTPVVATFYCSAAIVIGIIIIKLRNPVGATAEGISTFGSSLKAQSTGGYHARSFSVRFWVLLLAGLVLVFGLIRFVLLGPLYKCKEIDDPQQAPLMFAVRSTLQKMEFWFVGTGFILLAFGVIFSRLEAYYQEGHARRSDRGENLEDYGSTEALKDKLEQKHRQYQAWKNYFGGRQEQQEHGQEQGPRTEHLQETRPNVAQEQLGPDVAQGHIGPDVAGQTPGQDLPEHQSGLSLGRNPVESSFHSVQSQDVPAEMHPVAMHPAAEHPAAEHPAAAHPMAMHPAAAHPVAIYPAAMHSAAMHPGAPHWGAAHPVAIYPAAMHPAAVHSAAIHPAAMHPAAMHPAAMHPAAMHPVTPHSAAIYPAAPHLGAVHHDGSRIQYLQSHIPPHPPPHPPSHLPPHPPPHPLSHPPPHLSVSSPHSSSVSFASVSSPHSGVS